MQFYTNPITEDFDNTCRVHSAELLLVMI